MKISKILKEKMTFSFEVFPPKSDQPMEPLLDTLSNLYKYSPDFISCTYGAGGTNKGRSIETCKEIMKSGCNVMTHFTCIGNSREAIRKDIREYMSLGMENVLALRGDLPKGYDNTGGYFDYGDRLINFIKKEFPTLCIAGSGYPEKHIQARSFDADIAHLRSKQDNGAEFIMTQLCYDTDAYERYIERIRKAGVTLPVIVGVMPVLFKEGLVR
ncbi:MAG: methylenetetrahydrofolate reductase, partial [Anaerovoracaceae bacterium]